MTRVIGQCQRTLASRLAPPPGLVWKTTKILRGHGQWRASKPRAGSLTQIKVILSGRAENSARLVQIRPPRPNKSKGFTKMRSYFAPAIAIAMIMPAILSARSDDIPTLDVNPVCRGIASQSSLEVGLQQIGFEQCVQSEQVVREQLKKEWSTFSPSDKTLAAATMIGAHIVLILIVT